MYLYTVDCKEIFRVLYIVYCRYAPLSIVLLNSRDDVCNCILSTNDAVSQGYREQLKAQTNSTVKYQFDGVV